MKHPLAAALVGIGIVPIAAGLLLTLGWFILPAMLYIQASVEQDKKNNHHPQ